MDFENFVKEQLKVMSVAEFKEMMEKGIRERIRKHVRPDGTVDLVAMMRDV